LFSQGAKSAKQVSQIFGIVIVSSTVAVLFALLQLKGIFLLPFNFAQAETFNTLGSAHAVAVIAAILLPASMTAASGLGKVWKGVLGSTAILLFSSLLLLDFSAAWIVAIAGLVILMAFDIIRQQKRPRAGKVSLPMIFLLVSLFFAIVASFSIPGAPVKQAEVSPNYRGELAIIKGLVLENPFAAVVGTGPGTFVFEYTKFKSSDTNQSIFWNTRFTKGKAEILDLFITKGLLGLLAFGVCMALVFLFLLQKIIRQKISQEKESEEDGIVIQDMFQEDRAKDFPLFVGMLGSFVGVGVSLFVHPSNFMIWFLFWLLAAGAAFFVGKEFKVSLSSGPSFVALGSSLGLMVMLIVGVGVLFVSAQRYVAEMSYARGLEAVSRGEIQEAITHVRGAADIHASNDSYWRNLAQLYVGQANQIAANQGLSGEARQQQVGSVINDAIRAAQIATDVSPNNVANWNVRGFVYRSLVGVPEADVFAIQSYEKSQELEPVSPFPATELGRVKIVSSQNGNDELLEEAISDLKKAVALKPDYAPAHYLLAVAYDQQGNQTEAVAQLESTKIVAPNDIGLAFQLGVVYYRQDEIGKARDEFERAKIINPRYSNARYMLGLAYDRLGRKEDARIEFAAVAALNPDNQEVKEILANLAAGRAALSGIGEPPIPPIEENPEEITEKQIQNAP
jgi:tetratricopeptide (TPR) repeat protein